MAMTIESKAAEAGGAVDKTLKDAEGKLRVLVERLEHGVQEALELARSRSKVYAEGAGEQLETAQKYVTERVQERPLAATAVAVGVGVVIGLLLSGGRNR
jgi:ElaB/YqjD/DUF883 family membrane-anchored ribosome-binding protein